MRQFASTLEVLKLETNEYEAISATQFRVGSTAWMLYGHGALSYTMISFVFMEHRCFDWAIVNQGTHAECLVRPSVFCPIASQQQACADDSPLGG